MSDKVVTGHLLPDPPEVQEKADTPAPHTLIFRALLKQMKPVQAIIFMRIYEQFPYRFLPDNDFYFKPSIQAIISEMRIKEPVYWLMVTRLVAGGWLTRRKSRSGGVEVCIQFDKLRPFVAGGKA